MLVKYIKIYPLVLGFQMNSCQLKTIQLMQMWKLMRLNQMMVLIQFLVTYYKINYLFRQRVSTRFLFESKEFIDNDGFTVSQSYEILTEFEP